VKRERGNMREEQAAGTLTVDRLGTNPNINGCRKNAGPPALSANLPGESKRGVAVLGNWTR